MGTYIRNTELSPTRDVSTEIKGNASTCFAYFCTLQNVPEGALHVPNPQQ